ncbi:uncharacterized protein EI90DRAFT_3119310 [Cantharellus anzutake]|uniref:uncharacterized protein n=1 Tax=Cantharellus anzutake TaxID=1750568 RepID=UPI0019085E92|nr:uncharacterized protein EI90DRAFT_3119310 [Cantharellus anzutake]KAF8336991.1 hypothetical protein EI90DRAFT_3119310 [Cantharellus anzutake]
MFPTPDLRSGIPLVSLSPEPPVLALTSDFDPTSAYTHCIGSDFDRVVASSTHDLAIIVEAVDEDGLVPHEPVPLVDLNLPIPPIPILVGDNDEVEQVPVPVLTQLAQAITYLARSTARPAPIPVLIPAPIQPPTPSTSLQTKVREPNQFGRVDPRKLLTFLVQCELNFQDHPLAFEFVLELKENPMGDAEDEILQLSMKDRHHINKYILHGYGEPALHQFFYDGLPEHLKDDFLHVTKPTSLSALQKLMQTFDMRYWKRKAEAGRHVRPPPSSATCVLIGKYFLPSFLYSLHLHFRCGCEAS